MNEEKKQSIIKDIEEEIRVIRIEIEIEKENGRNCYCLEKQVLFLYKILNKFT
jgi:hypothetical protein